MANAEETFEVVDEQNADADSPSALFDSADDDVDGDVGEPVEAGADSDVGGGADDESAGEQGVTDAQQATEPQPSQQPDRVFKLWNGREVSAKYLAEHPELLEDIVMTANQAPILQRKYVEMLESLRTQQPQAQQQVQQQREKTPEELLQEYDRVAEEYAQSLIRAGVISEESYAVVPDVVKMTARVASDVMALANAYAEVRRVLSDFIAPIFEQTAQVGYQMVMERAKEAVNERLANAVKSAYPGLAASISQEDISGIAGKLLETYGPQIVDADDNALLNAAFGTASPLLAKVAGQPQPAARAQQQSRRRVPPSAAPEGVSPKAPSRMPNQDILDLFKGG